MQQQQQMTPQARDGFEEGAGLVFSAWTALVLAVENEWGGQDSASKADAIIDDTIQWFYRKREHHVDELEVQLTDDLLEEFNVEVQDGSANQVARSLVELYQACCRNDAGPLQLLRQRQAAGVSGAATSKRSAVDLDGAEVGDSSSSGSDDDDMDEDDDDAPQAAAAARQPPAPPVVDADGFEMVQTRSQRRGNAGKR